MREAVNIKLAPINKMAAGSNMQIPPLLFLLLTRKNTANTI